MPPLPVTGVTTLMLFWGSTTFGSSTVATGAAFTLPPALAVAAEAAPPPDRLNCDE